MASRLGLALRPVIFFASSALAILPRTAFADPRKDADALFEKGVRGMESGDFGTACPALEQSYRLDPLPGTLFTVAECERLSGKTATSLRRYEQFLELATSLPPAERRKHRERERVAEKQREELGRRAPRILIELTAKFPPDAELRLDERVLDLGSLATPIRVDPGTHVVVMTTSDGATRRTVRVGDGDEKTVTLSPPEPLAASADPPSDEPSSQPSGSSAIPTAAYVSGGIALAGIAAGSAFGLLALGRKGAVTSGCNAQKECTPEGKSAADSAQALAMGSNVGFAIAAAAGITTVIILLASRGEPTSAGRTMVRPVVGVGGPRDVFLGLERAF